MLKTACILLMVSCSSLAVPAIGAADIIVLAKPLSNAPADVDSDCPPDHICLRSWFHWTIAVTRTLVGPPLAGRVKAAAMQHMTARTDRRKEYLFVLAPIDNGETRALLGVDYEIREISWPQEFYCLGKPPAEYGLKIDDVAIDDRPSYKQYCFEIPANEAEE